MLWIIQNIDIVLLRIRKYKIFVFGMFKYLRAKCESLPFERVANPHDFGWLSWTISFYHKNNTSIFNIQGNDWSNRQLYLCRDCHWIIEMRHNARNILLFSFGFWCFGVNTDTFTSKITVSRDKTESEIFGRFSWNCFLCKLNILYF